MEDNIIKSVIGAWFLTNRNFATFKFLSGDLATMMLMGMQYTMESCSVSWVASLVVIRREVSLLVPTGRVMRRPQIVERATIGFTL